MDSLSSLTFHAVAQKVQLMVLELGQDYFMNALLHPYSSVLFHYMLQQIFHLMLLSGNCTEQEVK